MVSAHWKAEPLGNVATLQRGFDLPHRLRKPGTVPIVTSSGIEDTHCEAKVKAPGVVTGRYGTIGEVFFVRHDFWPLNTTLYVRDFHGNDPLFVSYLLRTIDFHTHSGKSGVPGVNRNDLHEIIVPLPPTKAEQEAIAEALSDADALIESLEQLLTKKRQIKQGAMQELLTGKKRLPGFSGEWEVKAVDELGDCFAGGTPSTFRPEYWGGEICWLPSGRVQNCILDRPSENETRITKRGLDESAAKRIKAHSVLVAITGATCANVACLEFEASANQSVVAIEPNSTVNYRFVYYSMLMERDAILSLQSGSAQGGVNLKAVKSIPLRLPSLPEQTAIAAILSDMDAEIAALEAKLAKARQIKQGMMQELLTGRTRLV